MKPRAASWPGGRQRGNVFALLFGAVALTGVLASVGMQTLTGPVTTITRVTQKNIADNNLLMDAKIIVNAAVAGVSGGDPDSDGIIEPAPFVTPGGGETAPTGGGFLPTDIGLALTDPWGSRFGYCVWDHGSTNASANRLTGDNTASASTQPVIAIIAAGPDKQFQTTCTAYAGGPVTAAKTAGSDDLIFRYTYAEATASSNGLWTLNTTDQAKAELKDAGGTARVTIDRSTGIGDFLGVTTDTIAARTGSITLDGGLRLDTDTNVTACAAAGDAGVVRYNGGTGRMEVCDGSAWKPAGAAEPAGASGDVQFNNGAGGLGADAALHWDNTNKRLGIGTSGPAARLDVVGTAPINQLRVTSLAAQGPYSVLFQDGGSTSAIGITASARGLEHTGTGSFNISQLAVGSSLLFSTQGSEVMRITSAGNVGIGTTTPSTKLHVSGQARISSTLTPQLSLIREGNTNASIYYSNDTGGVYAGSGVSGSFAVGQAADLSTSPSFIVTSSGAVGIGTASPESTLHVISAAGMAIRAEAGGGKPSLFLENPTSGAPYLQFPNGSILQETASGVALRAGASSGGTHTLYLQAGSANRVTVTPAGAVGIATTNPQAQLDVAGGIKVGGDAVCNASKAGTVAWNASQLEICDGTSFKNVRSIDALDDIGDVYLSESGNPEPNNNEILAWNATDNRWEAKNINTVGSAVATPGGSDMQVQFNDGGTLAGAPGLIYDKATGNVGIGTTAPAALLDIRGGNTSAVRLAGTPQIGLNVGYELWSDNALGGEMRYAESGSQMILNTARGIATSRALKFQLGGTTYAGLYNDGGFSVGAAAPNASAAMDVQSTTKGFLPPRMTQAQRDAISAPATGLVVFNTDTAALNTYNGSSWSMVGATAAAAGSTGQVQFNNGGALAADSAFFWDNTNKRLGIGTTNPLWRLHAYSSATGVSLIDGPTNPLQGFAIAGTQFATLGSAAGAITSAAATDLALQTSSGAIQFATAGTSLSNIRMTVASGGNVGIGTTTPQSKLDVAGGVRVGADATCSAAKAGMLAWNANALQICLSSGAWATLSSSSGTPAAAGADTQIQFNDAGSLGGDTGLTWNKTTDTLRIGGTAPLSLNGEAYQYVAAFDLSVVKGSYVEFLDVTPDNLTMSLFLQVMSWDYANTTEFYMIPVGYDDGSTADGTIRRLLPISTTGKRNGHATGWGSGDFALEWVKVSNTQFTLRIRQIGDTDQTTSVPYRILITSMHNMATVKNVAGTDTSNYAYPIYRHTPLMAWRNSVGIMTANPVAMLDVAGGVRVGADATCSASKAGMLAWNANTLQVCLSSGSWATISSSGGAASAAGSTGQVQFNDGAGGLGADSAFFWDNTNKRLGIGTTTPTALLSVFQATGYSREVIGSGNGTGAILVLDGNANGDGAGADYAWLEHDGTTGNLEFTSTGTVPHMVVSPSGNVGIGTTAPSSNLHLYENNASEVATELLRLDNPSGNVTNNGTSIGFYQSGNQYGRIRNFYTAANGWTLNLGYGANDHLSINSSGNVGIGTTSPNARLSLGNNVATGALDTYGEYQIILYDTGVAGTSYGLGIRSNTLVLTTNNSINFDVGGTTRFAMASNGNVTITGSGTTCVIGSGTGATNCTSDERLKTDIKPIESALQKLARITGVTFEWKDKEKDRGPHLGVIAQDVEKVFPEAVTEVDDKTLGKAKAVDYAVLVAPLIEAVKELKATNDNLKNAHELESWRYRQEIEALKAANDNLARSVEALHRDLGALKRSGAQRY